MKVVPNETYFWKGAPLWSSIRRITSPPSTFTRDNLSNTFGEKKGKKSRPGQRVLCRRNKNVHFSNFVCFFLVFLFLFLFLVFGLSLFSTLLSTFSRASRNSIRRFKSVRDFWQDVEKYLDKVRQVQLVLLRISHVSLAVPQIDSVAKRWARKSRKMILWGDLYAEVWKKNSRLDFKFYQNFYSFSPPFWKKVPT